MAGNNIYVQGSYVDIHDNEVVNLSVDKGEVHVGDNGKAVVAEGGGDNDIIKEVIQQLRAEEIISHLYDYTWVMLAMNDTQGLPSFDSPQSFVTFMKNIGLDCLPSESSIKKKNEKVLGVFPDLTFIDADKTEGDRRVNVGKRFLNLYRSRVK
ncbi:hypothetical protein [Xylanibacter ruminicola]|jgi:hypothetical protein|uniref:Uncharacterized protein n=1 Tax=Xylanibacter ruminicola TaxID=839 RepID=A0A1M6VA27_XYLRU|nr:hypothetical protein [Xylanibacter ruminicola]SHK78308.1 hypothetical protein SAMN05216463_11210 [Xylanibacter ruminicola]